MKIKITTTNLPTIKRNNNETTKKKKEIDYMELYQLFNKKQEVTINLYSLTLDWLFILGLINKGENGKIKKCF